MDVVLEHVSGRQLEDGCGQANILTLRDADATFAGIAGVKAANLAKLLQGGFPVPTGIVVTTAAFTCYLHQIPTEDGKETRRWILSHPLDSAVQEELRKALQQLGDGPFAVRSSAVAEDLEVAAFAGQYDTFLGLREFEDIEEAIRKCWASAYSDHVRQYHSVNQSKVRKMAVLIQPMIDADVAGVAFSANPLTGNRSEVVINAVRGLGERLVSGHATPDEWVVRDNQATANSTPELAVTSEQVLQVAQLVRRVEAYYGKPQDIEWVIRNNQLYLLQARPITTLTQQESPAMIQGSIDPPGGFWERENSHYPEPLMPMTRTTFLPAVNHAFRLVCDEMSLLIETIELREIGGWVYQRTVPLGGKDRKALPAWLIPILIRLAPPLKSRIAGLVHAIREDKAGRWVEAWYSEWRPSRIERAEQVAKVELHSLSDEELVRHLDEAHEFLKSSLDIHMKLNGGPINLMLAEFAFVCQELLEWDETKIMLMFSGLSEMSCASAKALAQLAQFVRTQPRLALDIEAEVGLSELQHRHPEFIQKFANYMRTFGCRAIRYELAFPTIAETPETSLRLLRDQLHRNYRPEDDVTFLQQQRRSLLTEAESILQTRSESDRVRFDKALARAEKVYSLREEHGFYDRDVPLALFRYALLEAGRRLVERGQIDKVDHVFFLEFSEAIEALKENMAFREVIRRRQAERTWVLAHPGPVTYGTPPAPMPSMAAFPQAVRFAMRAVFWTLDQSMAASQSGRVQTDEAHIHGIAASSGRYTGRVRLIRDESEFDKIQPGDVLVCPITSPVWSILFPSIGALVTDSGGILSHSAIIAREYRLPAVVATGNATTLLRDGQLVSVDGDKGVVEAI